MHVVNLGPRPNGTLGSLCFYIHKRRSQSPVFAEEPQSHLLLGSLQQCTQLRIFPGFL